MKWPDERRGDKDDKDVIIHSEWRKPKTDTRPILWAFFIIVVAFMVAFFIDVAKWL